MRFLKNKKLNLNFLISKTAFRRRLHEEDGSRTYASLDESTREAKDIECENLIPAHGYVNTSPSENMSKAMVDCLLEI